MNYIVKLYNATGLVLAEFHVITGSRDMAVESALIQYNFSARRIHNQVTTHYTVRICEECDIPVRII